MRDNLHLVPAARLAGLQLLVDQVEVVLGGIDQHGVAYDFMRRVLPPTEFGRWLEGRSGHAADGASDDAGAGA